ncbi:hypothetical protein [Methanobacterium formicicum]|uniref:Uncharacterized protein n=1 Tax=Methanobacterium formicicum TaxID=2162 RepID=A0A843ATK7_METFO|nr:hypothetical protein [Methanobacterium formicicum]MBF4474574.1 hypothetical protein [Methanobacterium formicicum]
METGELMVEDTKPLFSPSQEEVRTSATVFKDDLKTFKAIARLKFDSDPMNNAWKEAVILFIQQNKSLLKETAEQIPDKKI